MLETGIAAAPGPLVSEADHQQLSRLLIEHVWRVDNGRADTVYELYTEDAEVEVGTAMLRGRQAIHKWGKQLVESPPWRTIRHVCGNMRFVADGPDRAIGTSVLTVFMVLRNETAVTLPFSVGEDHDRFVRTEQGWRLKSRRWVELFARGDVLTLPQEEQKNL
jgi:3-phenylpropionate/cinnamic acid dioxygenase small subunit